jgi:UDP:flavonoid glycosyltransferase YjiC (YdhE family)
MIDNVKSRAERRRRRASGTNDGRSNLRVLLSVVGTHGDVQPVMALALEVLELGHRSLAVVHHGGAGTTLAAARAEAPQVVVPMFSDQPYWGRRVRELRLGSSVPTGELTVERLASTLNDALQPAVAERADSIAPQLLVDGAAVAARRLVDESRDDARQ